MMTLSCFDTQFILIGELRLEEFRILLVPGVSVHLSPVRSDMADGLQSDPVGERRIDLRPALAPLTGEKLR